MSISNLLQTNDFVQRNNAKALASKWERTGLLEGLKGETEKAALAVAEVKKLNPNANLSTNTFVFKPMSASPQSYKDWYEKKYLPLYRKAGLPE